MTKPALRTYQIADLAFYIANPRCANLSDPGTGKTPSVCVYQWFLWNEYRQRTAWLMPKSLLKKNKDEILRFTHFKPEDVMIIDGTRDKRAEQMRSDAKVFLMGFARWAEDWQTMLELHPDIKAVMIDEFHMGFKGNRSSRTEQLRFSMRSIPIFLPMTGTMIDGRLDTAYPAIEIIEPRYYGSHSAFMNYHAVKDEYGTLIGWENHEKLARIFGHHCIRHSFKEVFGDEVKVIQLEKCEMSPKQREAYDEFHVTAMLELEDEFLDGTLPGVHTNSCASDHGAPRDVRARRRRGHRQGRTTDHPCDRSPEQEDAADCFRDVPFRAGAHR